MKISAPGQGLPSQTRVIVERESEGYALVRCELLTGRQHQIRIHLASGGTPVVGDKLYGPDERIHARAADGKMTHEDLALMELPRQALHAAQYDLAHALTWAPLSLMAPLPADMLEFWRERTGESLPEDYGNRLP